MRRSPSYLIFVILFSSLLFWVACEKDNLLPEPEVIPEADEINKFIWDGLKTYYFWTTDVPNLNNSEFEKKDNLNKFLNNYTDPEELFESLLYERGTVDKWSFIVDDSQKIDDWISGISESMGYDFRLSYIEEGSNNLVGYVRYVLKDSPADKAGVKRGDLFLRVNGTQLTVDNYFDLLFTDKTYSIDMASISDEISLNGKTNTMTAIDIHENPILLDTVYQVDGFNVGYLMYNSFTSEDEVIKVSYDDQLNNVFGGFKTKGVQKLIVDLRYNGGGSVQTATYLASMIYSTDKTKIYYKRQYNELLERELTKEYGKGWNINYFTDKLIKTDITSEAEINSIGLTDLYVITSEETASASELLINGLTPYISVKVIGENTAGKNVGSITVRDWNKDGKVNPNHKWAMQPIILKIANSNDFYDYVNGLEPDIEAFERVSQMRPLGDIDEELLKIAIDDIKGVKSAIIQPIETFKPFTSSKLQTRFASEMYLNDDKLTNLFR